MVYYGKGKGRWMNTPIKPHAYVPDIAEAAGDCAVCGHAASSQIHRTPVRTPTDADPLPTRADSSWSTRAALRKLVQAGRHLLDDHQCDAHGYEEVRSAIKAAEAALSEAVRCER